MNAVANRFKPVRGLKSPHIQSILASSKLRKLALGQRAKQFTASSTRHLLETPCGVTLECWHTPHPNPVGMITLIHGWEGSADSLYMLDTGSYLWQKGYSVTRLNMRDHGDTHHLNKELFHSARIEEVSNALAMINKQWPHDRNWLVGFSLGGNFALRVSTLASTYQVSYDEVIAICPPISPSNTMQTLRSGPFIYEKYFVKKWRKSLVKKATLHEHLDYLDDLKQMTSLDEMNDYFIGRFAPYATLSEYFSSYTLPNNLGQLTQLPTRIIATADDPVCPIADIRAIASTDSLSVEEHEYGGHCGFLDSYNLKSWVPARILEIINL